MQKTNLGSTKLMVTRTSFGVLPIQRTEMNEAVRILRRAHDAGINFYDTARAYTDSEEKIGRALGDVRDSIFIATKSTATTKAGVMEHLETSLRNLRTDYVDVFQLHNPNPLPDPDDPESAYAALVEAREKGMARHIGITSHRLETAVEAVKSGLYETLQYPLCYLSSDNDMELVDLCREADVGFIAMKPLSGGLLTNARTAFAFFHPHENVVPIWGIQHMHELEELVALDANPPALDDEMRALIERDRQELAGEFCRCCGYCLPCPQGIPIPMASRIHLLVRRMPYRQFLSDEWRGKMHLIENCTECGHCRSHCPYGLNPPALLKKALVDYEEFYGEHV